MNSDELIAKINSCFNDENQSGIPFKAPVFESTYLHGLAWQQVPDEALAAGWAELVHLGVLEFAYYLPAFMRLVVSDCQENRHIAAKLVELLKLPAELNELAVAAMLEQYERSESQAAANLVTLMQGQLAQTNSAIHRFVARTSRFNSSQGRVIRLFLVHLQDQYGKLSPGPEANLALCRYWFKFV